MKFVDAAEGFEALAGEIESAPYPAWRAANLDGMTPLEVAQALPVLAARCEEIGRDPASLKVSVHTWHESPGVSDPGQARVDLYGAYMELGVSRVQSYCNGFADGPEGPLFGRHFDLGSFAWLTGVEPPCGLYLCTQWPSEPRGSACQSCSPRR